MRINRVFAGVIAAAVGVASYFVYPSRYIAMLGALAVFAGLDRLGFIAAPFDPTIRDLLHSDDIPLSSGNPTSFGIGSKSDHQLRGVRRSIRPSEMTAVTSREEAETRLGELQAHTPALAVLSLIDFEQRLRETIIWCEAHADVRDPRGSLTRAPMDVTASRPGWRVVEEIAVWRRAALSSDIEAPKTGNGRLLVCIPEQSVIDGASNANSAAFFDDDDIPPSDTWIGWFDDRYLLAYAPSVLIPAVQAGIEVNCVESVQWLDKTNVGVRPVVEFLQATGLTT